MILLLFILYGLMFMGADIVAISLMPLRSLNIPYPNWWNYIHVIVPGVAAILGLAMFRRSPWVGALVVILLSQALIGLVPSAVDRRVATIRMGDYRNDWSFLDRVRERVDFKVFARSSGGVMEVFVAPQNEQRAREELARLNLLVKPSGE